MHGHDLEAEGELNGEVVEKKCRADKPCELVYVHDSACPTPVSGEAIGYLKAARDLLNKKHEENGNIRVHGELTEGFVGPSAARVAREAAAGCLATTPLQVAVGGVATDDPLTETPLASGYGTVSVSPPGVEVSCPYVTDYRDCFGTWQLPLGANVTLTAKPDPTNHSYLAGWSGSGTYDCPSSSDTCVVRAGQVSQITAQFGAPIYKLTIDNTTNPNLGIVAPSGFSNVGPTPDPLECGAGTDDCTAYYPLIDSTTTPNFNGPAPLSLGQNGIVTYDNEQWYVQFRSGCDSVQVVVDGSNRYTVCYYDMTSDRTIKVDWTTTPP